MDQCPGREKVILSGRCDELLVESDDLTRVSVSEAKIEVHDVSDRAAKFLSDVLEQTLVVLLTFHSVILFVQIFKGLSSEDWSKLLLLIDLQLITSVITQMDAQVGDDSNRSIRLVKFILESSFGVFDDHSSADLEVSIHPSVPQASSVGLDTGLEISKGCMLGDWGESQAWRISVSSNDFEIACVRVELFSDCECNH